MQIKPKSNNLRLNQVSLCLSELDHDLFTQTLAKLVITIEIK